MERMTIRIRPRTLFTIFLLALFAFGVMYVRDLPFKARVYPWAVGFPVIALLLVQLVKDLRPGAPDNQSDEDTGAADIEFTAEEATPAARRKTMEMFAWIYGFVLVLWLMGYFLSLPLMVFAFLRRHRESWSISLILPTVAWALLWGVFNQVLHLPFPPGRLFEWFG